MPSAHRPPDWRAEARRHLAAAGLDPAHEDDVAEELAQHLEDRYAELRARGRGDEEARREALAELRGVRARELRRDPRAHPPATGAPTRGGAERWLDALAFDLRHAARALRLDPTFAAVALTTLALGIGACAVIFSAVDAVLLRPLPYPEPERLVAYWGTAPEKGLREVSMPEGVFLAQRARARTLAAAAAHEWGWGFNLAAAGGDPQRVEGAAVSADFFRVMGVAPLLGRTFAPGEGGPEPPPVAVLGHALWRDRFGGDRSVVGRAIDLSGRPYTVIGVMPPGFDFPHRAALYVPLPLDPTRFNCWCDDVVARMRPGVTPEDVRRDIEAVTDAFALERRDVFPDAKPGGSRFVAQRLGDRLVGDVERPLVVLLGAGAAVLLIACANIANLMLARAAARERELAVRCAIGASPRRVAAQLLTEGVLLGATGAALGGLLGAWGASALRRLPAEQFPRMDGVTFDWRALLFTAAAGALTGLLCGLAPALRAARLDVQDAMRAGTRGTASARARRLSDAFVVGQFALSLVLLVATGLLLRSYGRLLAVDPGYRAEGVLVARVSLPGSRYPSDTAVRQLYGRLLDRVAALPGVRAVGAADRVPLTPGNPQNNVVAEGKEPKAGEPVLVANVRQVSLGYFAAIGTPVVRGRAFAASDDERAPRVGVVDETFARHFWPGEDPIGKRFRYQGDTSAARWITVVGVVPNVKRSRLDEPPDLQVYQPLAQQVNWRNDIVVRTAGPPEAVLPLLRRELAALDPTLPLYDVHTMTDAVERSLSTRRLTSLLITAFGATALVMAAIGIYGVISVAVGARVREFGVRLALGAPAGEIGRMVLGRGLLLASLGAAAGLAGALAVGHLLRGLLFQVGPIDWVTFAAVVAVLGATALLACWLPARRATRVDPLVALQAE
ncbi:MAG: ADOP family duplicated permease [Gemmatimonadaceae bacterium]